MLHRTMKIVSDGLKQFMLDECAKVPECDYEMDKYTSFEGVLEKYIGFVNDYESKLGKRLIELVRKEKLRVESFEEVVESMLIFVCKGMGYKITGGEMTLIMEDIDTFTLSNAQKAVEEWRKDTLENYAELCGKYDEEGV